MFFILEIRYDSRSTRAIDETEASTISLEKREVFPHIIGMFKMSTDLKINRTLKARTAAKKLSLPEPFPIRACSLERVTLAEIP